MATLRLQTFFARVHKNSELLLLVSYRSVASTKSARARVGVSPQKCQSWHFLPRFHEKTLFFVIKVVRKYTRNSRGLLLMLPNDYTQNLEPPKKFLKLARKIHTTRFGESHFLSLLFLHPDRLETNGLHLPKRHCSYCISTQCHLSSTSIREMKQMSRVHSISQVVRFVR